MPIDADRTLPLHRMRLPAPGRPKRTELPNGTPIWLVTRYDDVRQLLTDSRFRRSLLHAAGARTITDAPTLLDSGDAINRLDGAEHVRLRRVISRAFTPRAVARMEPWVAQVVDGLVDGLIAAGPPADLITDYAFPLPAEVIRRLLAHDVEAERLLRWSACAFAGNGPDEAMNRRAAVNDELAEFTSALVTERRRAPGDDLVSRVVRAADNEGGVTEAQLVHLICSLLVGGQDSTMTVIGNALLYLLAERPQAWAAAGGDARAASLLADRLIHLIPLGDREERPGHAFVATENIDIGGVRILAGELATVDRLAANRDPTVFRGDLFEDLFAPLPHPTLSFGVGQHFCLGTWLARTEITLALHRLASRLPALRLTTSAYDISWRQGAITRSPLHLPATW
ncbi:cytochrome P450 [Streptomyces sp. OspMP-M43]|uniref:cytochrome P450 n=1 Tax=Streptomyces sp. OspMP-M43 TaxID=1839781 RepID=UPI00081B29A0|nr:cytochrome P450 [Streptomyces sp. OspMP-M43]SCD93103.1 Cytochrome P450 [Streptomyces sp. OspMP-M43]